MTDSKRPSNRYNITTGPGSVPRLRKTAKQTPLGRATPKVAESNLIGLAEELEARAKEIRDAPGIPPRPNTWIAGKEVAYREAAALIRAKVPTN
jgi:hypothetical protein